MIEVAAPPTSRPLLGGPRSTLERLPRELRGAAVRRGLKGLAKLSADERPRGFLPRRGAAAQRRAGRGRGGYEALLWQIERPRWRRSWKG